MNLSTTDACLELVFLRSKTRRKSFGRCWSRGDFLAPAIKAHLAALEAHASHLGTRIAIATSTTVATYSPPHPTPMATLALAVAGAAVGAAALPAGVSLFGATLTGAAIGSQVGAFAGSFVDRALFARLGPVARAAGPAPRRSCASPARPKARPSRASTAARASAARSSGPPTSRRRSSPPARAAAAARAASAQRPQDHHHEYRYFASFAVALAEGEITGIGRVWADGKELDLSTVTHRLYTGSDTQAPDSLIEAREGAGNAPAYRGIAYIVFERLALANFGNRIPQLSFEVHRAVDPLREPACAPSR